MSLNKNGLVKVSITDNVLETEDWGIDILTLNDGKVVKQEVLRNGCYQIPRMWGWTVDQLVEWSQYDGTRNHPEQCHNVDNITLIDVYLEKKRQLQELEKIIQSIFIHPGVWSNVEHDQKKALKERGWVCVNPMVPVESWHGFGSLWMKDCSEEEYIHMKEHLHEIEDYLTTNDNG